MERIEHLCPVCGQPGLYEPPYDARGVGSHEICPCCGFHFGLDDDPDREAGIRAWRARWRREGCRWFSAVRTPPAGWHPPAWPEGEAATGQPNPPTPFERAKGFLARRGMADRVMEFDASSATVELAAAAVGVIPARIAKTLSFQGQGGEGCLLVLAAGDRKIDNPKFKACFGMKAKMLPPDAVRALLGYEVGGVCPFDVDPSTPVYLDRSLLRFDTVYPACGSGNSAARLTCQELFDLSGAVDWVDVSKPIEG
jgi:prolyl-tRNA editing enzyme YbaK/EbsC (Cys-tRNA(Pro) deacylase)